MVVMNEEENLLSICHRGKNAPYGARKRCDLLVMPTTAFISTDYHPSPDAAYESWTTCLARLSQYLRSLQPQEEGPLYYLPVLAAG